MTIDFDMPLYRPPSEGNNVIIQATLGCSFNQCSFCSMYKQKSYLARPLDEVFADIEQAAKIWPQARRVFLADGDALALPTEQLLLILQKLAQHFQQLTRVSCYATPANLLHKSVDELSLLKHHKLNLVYLGIETGSDVLLKKITKGATRASIVRAARNAFDSGIKTSATVILGIGGKQFHQQHIDGTIELLNQAPLTYLSTLQLFLDASAEAEFYEKFAADFEHQDDDGILLELSQLIAGIDPPQPLIFRSNHASNALPLAGNLPADREALLLQIEQAMKGKRGLRPAALRGL